MNIFSQLLIMLSALISSNAFCQDQHVIRDPASSPKLISDRFSFTEGPAVDRSGNIYFTDQPNNKIWKYDTDGKLSVFLDKTGRSNGMYFDHDGNLVTCADEQNQLWSIAPDGKVTVLVKNFHGHTFNGPNDLWIDSKGGIYFSDPYFQRDYWTRKTPDPAIGGERLYYLQKGKNEAILVDSLLKKPNGLVGSADGKTLYLSDMGKNSIFKYDINKDGTLSNRRLFAQDISDGMTLDNAGNVYLSGKGVIVYSPEGKKIDHIEVPAKWTANICFGGKNKDILFITASESFYMMPMKVKGIE